MSSDGQQTQIGRIVRIAAFSGGHITISLRALRPDEKSRDGREVKMIGDQIGEVLTFDCAQQFASRLTLWLKGGNARLQLFFIYLGLTICRNTTYSNDAK